EGVFAVGIAFAIAGGCAIDIAAEEDFCGARRTKRLAHAHRRRVAARHQGKVLAVTAAHAKGGPGAGGCHRTRRRRRLLVEAARIGEEVRLRWGLALLLFLGSAE